MWLPGRKAWLRDDLRDEMIPLKLDGNAETIAFRIEDTASSRKDRFSIIIMPAAAVMVQRPTVEENMSVRVYPNPVSERYFNMQFINMPAGSYSLQLMTDQGQLAFQRELITEDRYRLQDRIRHLPLAAFEGWRSREAGNAHREVGRCREN
jgi:hypothetical protein